MRHSVDLLLNLPQSLLTLFHRATAVLNADSTALYVHVELVKTALQAEALFL